MPCNADGEQEYKDRYKTYENGPSKSLNHQNTTAVAAFKMVSIDRGHSYDGSQLDQWW